jgi:hypothetical protein
MEVTNGGPRALSDFAYYNDTMTVEACVNACSAYTYAGIEYGRECVYLLSFVLILKLINL